jgi:hypothetical protein
VEVIEALPGRPITGERVVRPDGTISLGFYGDLKVAGLNRNQVKVKLLEHLRKSIRDEVLGLILEHVDGTVTAVPPVESNRVFIDESANYYPEGPERDAIRNGRLDVIEGWIHRVVKEMNEVKATINSTKAADPNEPGISDAEMIKRFIAENAQENNVGRLDFLEGQLYKALKELEEIRAKAQPAKPPPTDPAKPGASPTTPPPTGTTPG